MIGANGGGSISMGVLPTNSNLTYEVPTPKNYNNTFKMLKDGLGLAGDLMSGEIPGDISSLLEQQNEMQMMMLKVTFLTNNSRTEHEASMSVARNLRVA